MLRISASASAARSAGHLWARGAPRPRGPQKCQRGPGAVRGGPATARGAASAIGLGNRLFSWPRAFCSEKGLSPVSKEAGEGNIQPSRGCGKNSDFVAGCFLVGAHAVTVRKVLLATGSQAGGHHRLQALTRGWGVPVRLPDKSNGKPSCCLKASPIRHPNPSCASNWLRDLASRNRKLNPLSGFGSQYKRTAASTGLSEPVK